MYQNKEGGILMDHFLGSGEDSPFIEYYSKCESSMIPRINKPILQP